MLQMEILKLFRHDFVADIKLTKSTYKFCDIGFDPYSSNFLIPPGIIQSPSNHLPEFSIVCFVHN